MEQETKKAPGPETEGRKASTVVSATDRAMSREKLTKVPPEIIAIQRRRIAAKSSATTQLLNATEIVKDNAKRRRGRMWMIATEIKDIFVKEGVTIGHVKGQCSDEEVWIELKFGQGTYVDSTGKRREYRWKITIENIDCFPEGVCPQCDGELETEILDYGKRRVACNDEECGYEVPLFCGVEVPEC